MAEKRVKNFRKPFERKMKRKPAKVESKEEEPVLKKSMLINSAVITVRKPSKNCEMICKQLRKILAPNCLTKLENNPKLQDVLDVSNQLLVKQVLYLSENTLRIGVIPNGPTYDFKIVEYENNFKSFSNDIYKIAPFLTFEGKSPLKQIFQRFGETNQIFQRVVHFHFKNDLIYIRHFTKSTEDTDDNFKVHLKEIGPRFTLKHIKTENGIFSDLKVKTRFKNRFADEEE